MIHPDTPGPLLLFLLLLLVAPRAWSRPAGPLGLNEAIETALRENRGLAILEKEIERAEGAVAVSSRLFRQNPELSGRVERRGAPAGPMIDYSLALGQPIEIRGQRAIRRRIAEFDRDRARLRLDRERWAVRERVKGIFIDLAALHNRMVAVEGLREVEERLARWLDARAARGEVSPVERNTVDLEALLTRQRLLRLRQRMADTREDLAWAMNRPLPPGLEIDYRYPAFPGGIPGPDDPAGIGDEDLPRRSESPDTLARIDAGNYDVRLARLALERAACAVRLARAEGFLPALTPSLVVSRDDGDNLIGMGVAVRLPAFHRNRGGIAAARADSAAAVLKLRSARDRVRSRWSRDRQRHALDLRRKTLFDDRILPLSRASMEETEARYRRGEIGLAMLERYADAWAGARADYADFMEQYEHTLLRMESLRGREWTDGAGAETGGGER